MLNIDLKWCPIPSDHRAYTVDTAGEFAVSEDTVRVVEHAVEGVREGEVDEEKGWDGWKEWRWEWEKTYKVGDGEERPRWMEDGTWRERKTRRQGKKVEREKREKDQERDSEGDNEGSKRGKHEQHDKRGYVKEYGDSGMQSNWTDRRRQHCQQVDKDHSHRPATSMAKESKGGNDSASGASGTTSARRLGRRVSSGVVKKMDAWLAESDQENGSSNGDGKRRRLEEGDDAVDKIEIQKRTRVERWTEELVQENPVIIIEDDEDEGEGAEDIVPRIAVSRENSDVRGRLILAYQKTVNDGPGYDKLPQAYKGDENLPCDDHALYSPRMGVDMLLGRGKVNLEHMENMENIQVEDDTHVIGDKEATNGSGNGVEMPSGQAEDDKQSTYYGDEEYDAILDAALISMSEQELMTDQGKKAIGDGPIPIPSQQAWEAGFAADNGGDRDRNDAVPMLRWRGSPPLILPVFEPKGMTGLQQQPPQQQQQNQQQQLPQQQLPQQQQQQQNYHYHQQQQQQQNYQQQQQQQNYHSQQSYHQQQKQRQQLPSHVAPGAPLSSLPKQLSIARSNPFYHTTPRSASSLPVPASPAPAPKRHNMFDAFSARQSVDRFLAFRGMVKGVSRRDGGEDNVRDGGKDAGSFHCDLLKFRFVVGNGVSHISPLQIPYLTPDSIPYCELTAPLSIPPTVAAVDSEVPTVVQGKSKYFTHAGSEAAPGADVGKRVYRGDFVPASKLERRLG